MLPDNYKFCLAGHVHLHQKLGENFYYIGNPFASDWGEANQKKGYIIIKDGKLEHVASSIPGWYDPSWPKFPKNKTDWQDARIRIHVPIEAGKNYTVALAKAKQDAEHKYPGALITPIPEFEDVLKPDVQLKLSDSDATKVSRYVNEGLPDSLRQYEAAIVCYLTNLLEKAAHSLGLRAIESVEFLDTYGEWFLSFEKLKLKFEPGLWLITGVNHDWHNRSNGAGKSSLLSPVRRVVLFFGTTFKGRKA